MVLSQTPGAVAQRKYRQTHPNAGRATWPSYYENVIKPKRAANPLGRCGEHLLRTYGITAEQKEQMWLNQDKRCAICDVEINLCGRGGAQVDHKHDETKKIRGLLCIDCNRDIRVFETMLTPRFAKYVGWECK